jgi:hypothetical protein
MKNTDIINKTKNFLNSNYFIAIIYALTVVSWAFKSQIIMIALGVLIIMTIIYVDAKRINIATLIFAIIISYRNEKLINNIWIIVIYGALLLPFIIYDLIKSKINLKDNILISMFILIGAALLSLINTNRDNISLGIAGLIGFMVFTIVFIYFNSHKSPDDYRYLAKNALAMGLAIACEFAIYTITYNDSSIGKEIDLGWAISTHIAITYLTIIPMTFYLYIENPKRTYVLIALVIDFIVVLLLLCKGAYLAIGLGIIPFLVIAYKMVKDKKRMIRDFMVACIMLFFLLLIISLIGRIRSGVIDYFTYMNRRGWFVDSGRIKIYKVGLDVFFDYPLFGGGVYTGGYYLPLIGEQLKNYHNYFIQSLATMGIFGLLAFAHYLYRIVMRCVSVKHFYNICVLFVIIFLSIHGLVDTTWYSIIVMVILSIYLSALITDKEINQK